MAVQRYSQRQVIDALVASRGLVTYAADRLACAPNTIYAYCNRYSKVRAARDAARERQLDVAEDRLFSALDAGEPWAIQFVLTRLGRRRGYGDRLEIDAQVDVLASPEWVRTRTMLLQVLRAHPAAMADVVAGLRVLTAPKDEGDAAG